MALNNSQKNMYAHSEVKVRLLDLYLKRYLNVLNESKYTSDIKVYDLFCGEGIYPDGGKGSPIIMLETIKHIHFSNKARNKELGKLHCHFNDIESVKISNLKNEIQNRKLHYPEIGQLKITDIDYKKLVHSIANEINLFSNEKAFIFIDPYGYKDIRISEIKTLLESRKSEVLLFLPTNFMFRFENKKTPESLKQFINELIPETEWPKSGSSLNFIEKLKDAFRKAIGDSFFVDTFVISRSFNKHFCLFFFTSHIYGFDRMLDAKWKIDEEEGRGWTYNMTTDLFNQVEKKPNVIKFEKQLFKFLKEKNRTNKDVYEFTIKNGHLPTHTNDILRRLQNDKTISTISLDGKPARKNSFYVNYKMYKKEPMIVIKTN